MKKAVLIWLLIQLPGSAFAASRMTVDQLNREIASSHEKRDTKIASRLFDMELTERLSAAKLAALEKALPGPESRRALVLIADQAAFLNPPPTEIPNEPAPSFEQQRAIIAKTVDYVSQMVHRLPNLFALRDTIHFEDTPPGMQIGSRSGNMVAAQPLHPVSRSRVTVLYRDGQDFVQTSGKELAASTAVTTGLSTFGEFGPILATVLSDLPRGKLAWSHWEQGSARPVAVFSFAVPKAASHYQVRFCCVSPHLFQQLPGYHGEITIDPQDGTILRLTLLADLGKDDPIRKADLMVEYSPVELGGQKYFCPAKSISVSLAPEFTNDKNARRFGSMNGSLIIVPDEILADSPLQIMLNEVVFDHYHLFHSEARILTAGNSEPAPTSAATANSPTAPVEPLTSNPGVQPSPAGENPAPAASAAGVVTAANETAPAVPNSAVPPPIAAAPAVPSTPEISFVSPSDLPLTPAIPAVASTPSRFSLRVSTRLVDIGVTAYDKKGRPITDLARDDLVVSDNGKKQGIRSFSRSCAESAAPLTSASAAEPILYSNRLETRGSEQPAGTCSPESPTIILLDATSLGVAHFTRVRAHILKFLDRLPASAQVGLYVRDGDGFRVLAEGTASHAALSSALRGWMPNDQELAPARKEATRNWQLADAAQTATDMNYMNGTIGGNAAGTQNVSSVWEIPGGGSGAQVDPKMMTEGSERTRQSLIVLGAVAAHMGAIPEHKNLVWLAADNVLADWTDQTAGSSNGPYSLASLAMRTQEALNDARVSLYPLDASQIETAAIDARLQTDSVQLNPTVRDRNPNGSLDDASTLPGARASDELRQNSHSVHGAFQQMAEATGGRSFNRSENVVTGLISVVEDGQATYLLSFTPGTQPDDQFHRLTITAPTRRGIALRYRAGYLYSKEPTTLKDRFKQVIWQPLDATEIALSVHRAPVSVGAAVSLNIAATDISLAQQGDRRTGKLDIFLVQRDQAGRRAEVKEQTLALDLKPATYEKVMRDGVPFDQYFDNKQDAGIVRIIVVDENSGRIGSVTLPAAAGSVNP
jgi:VWFA-related protein